MFLLVVALAGCGVPSGPKPARGVSPHGAGGSEGSPLRVAAASDLVYAMEELVEGFARRTGIRVVVSTGSSGNFAAQIRHGAPFDLFFSADTTYPQALVREGLANPGSAFVYAIGRIVVWVPAGSPVDVNGLGIRAVLEPTVRRVAIANPAHAPYGRAAEAALRHLGLYEVIRDKLVYGENIAQAAQFVQSGSADLGIIALSLALAPNMRQFGRFAEIPPDSYPALDQGAVILKRAEKRREAWAFREYVQSKEGHTILRRYGFLLPGESKASVVRERR